ncbi:hypothetical protein DDZ15_01190 [Rhodohalobacter mucosus]|uniref:IS1595 family transposase n=1 Tax=Rhodohalobacter mucosus TaxID=2079485 RepID=A0A316TTC1_9BACT|nr:hypothetical protein DDZ15_01190 [Rhodohalobacter mucosus]
MNNKYVNRAKISEAKFRELVRYFVLDLNAKQIAELTKLNRNTVNRYLTEIRRKIDRYCTATSELPRVQSGPPDASKGADIQYVLIRYYRGKIITDPVFGSGNRSLNDQTWVKTSSETGFSLVIDPETGTTVPLTQDSARDQGDTGMNRVKSFWANAKTRMAKFKGLHPSTYRYHLRECEFRFNNRDKDLYQLLLKILRKDPLF